MAAVGAEVTGLMSGVVGFFLLLFLLSIFLAALCSECSRDSLELHNPKVDKSPSALIRVVKLEDVARENPMISEIQSDEKEFNPDEGNSVTFTPWRSHLGAPQHQDLNSAAPPDSAHIYNTIGGRRSAGDGSSVSTNHEPADKGGAADLSDSDRNSVYARVSKKIRLTTPPVITPEVQVVVEEEEEEDESSPPLPNREASLEG
ncbi:hypothetical protein PAMA_000905 [Pampus argenteus]